jgi:hypothetical protein
MKVRLTDVRLAFVDLFEVNKKYGKYGVRALFAPGGRNEQVLNDAIDQAGREAFADKWPTIKKSLKTANKLVIHSGDDHEDKPDYKDKIYINANNKIRPAVHGRDGAPLTKEDEVIYPGCRADVIINVFGFTNPEFGKFIGASLLGVQFRADADRMLIGAYVDEEDFKPITDGADADDL